MGLVIVYVRKPYTEYWYQEAVLNSTGKTPSAAESVGAISHDGNTLVTTTIGNGAGYKGMFFVYVRDPLSSAWSLQFQTPDTIIGNAFFFISLSADGNTLIAARGIGAAHSSVFGRDVTYWTLRKQVFPNAGPGYSISTIAMYGKTFAVQSSRSSGGGAHSIMFYKFINGDWTLATSPFSVTYTGTYAGFSMIFANDMQNMFLPQGRNKVIAYTIAGIFYNPEFVYQDSAINLLTTLDSDANGEYIVFGDDTSRKATILKRTSTSPLHYESFQNITIGTENLDFGTYVSLSSDARWLMVNAPDANSGAGSVYIYERRLDDDICKPKPGINKRTCQRRIPACVPEGVDLKWTGAGCKKKGKKVGDGGCQCKGYCGYTCKKACNKDKECRWINSQCRFKASNELGYSMPVCQY